MYEVETAFARRRGDIGVQDGEENSGQENSDLSRKRTREEENLLKDVLRRNKYQKGRNFAEEEPIPEESEFAEKTVEEKEEEEIIRQEAKKPWLLGSIVDEANEHGFVENRKTFNMFANTNIYVFFRHLATLYTRLSEVKDINEAVTEEIKNRKVVQFAKDLNLISTQLSDMGLDFEGADAYGQVLTLSKRLIEGDIEHQWFEESLRQASFQDLHHRQGCPIIG